MSNVALDGNVTDQNGAAVPGALVYVYDKPGGLAPVYDSMGQIVANPVTAGEDGYWQAYVPTNLVYTLRYFWGGRERRVEANIVAGTPPLGVNTDANLRSDLATSSGATGVGFQQGGTGSVVRTAAQELGERITPYQKGALGDGGTSDSAALNAALAYAATVGGHLVIPPGIFACATDIVVPNGVRGIVGEGGTLKSTGGNLLYLKGIADGAAANVKDVLITGVTFDLNGQAVNGIWGDCCSRVRITNNTFKGMTAGSANIGIRIFVTSFSTEAARDNIIADNDFDVPVGSANAYSIQVGGWDATYADVVTYWKANFTLPTPTYAAENTIISNNLIRGGEYGISLFGATLTNVTGNRIALCTRGISIQNSCRDTLASSNIISDCSSTCILNSYNSVRTTIEGNKLFASTGTGTMLEANFGSADLVVRDNDTYSSTTSAFHVYVGPMSQRAKVINNRLRGTCARAYIAAESAYDSGQTVAWSRGSYNGTGTDLMSNANLADVHISGNVIEGTSAVAGIAVTQPNDAQANSPHLVTGLVLKDNVLVGSTYTYAIAFTEEQAGTGISGVVLNGNVFDAAIDSTKVVLPRAFAHFGEMQGNSGAFFGMRGSVTADVASIAAQSVGTASISIPGATVGDYVTVSASTALETGLSLGGEVTAADTVTVKLTNPTASAIDPASRAYYARVVKR